MKRSTFVPNGTGKSTPNSLMPTISNGSKNTANNGMLISANTDGNANGKRWAGMDMGAMAMHRSKHDTFTPEELEEIRRADREIDAQEVTEEELQACDNRDAAVRGARNKNGRRCYEWYLANQHEIAKQRNAYYMANREKTLERVRTYNMEHREEIAAYKREWYQKNKSKINAKKKAYKAENREKVREKERAYYEANREKIKERNRAYYEANKEKIKEKKRAYQKANREKCAEYMRRYRAKKRSEKD